MPRRPASDDAVTGRITMHPDGYGFVRPEDGGRDVFVPPRATGGARHGDRVAVHVTTVGRDGRRSGRVRRIVEPTGQRLVGLFRRTGDEAFVIPLERSGGSPVPVRDGEASGARDGHLVLVDLGRAGRAGRVERVLGRPGEPGVDETVVMVSYRLPEAYPESATRDAEAQAEDTLRRLRDETREDFRDWPTVTIDGETAKDFDDAVSIRRLGKGRVRLAIHIADVAAFVPEGSPVDAEALSRATSVYFPGRVIPMLPTLLADDLCSLVAGRDRAVQSVVMDFDRTGRRIGARFHDGWIRSRQRLTYTEVSEFLEGTNHPLGRTSHGEDLQHMAELARRLRDRRFERGSLDFDLPEPEILLDMDGVAHGVQAGERNEAHRLIEEFMIAANEAVAEALDEAGRPNLYRIHDPPDPAKVQALADAIRSLGYRLPRGRDGLAPSDLAGLVAQSRGRPEERFVHSLVLRSLMQAKYSEVPGSHFGLASERYSHFTSPIRRYPDLVTHRVLRAWRHRSRESAAGRDRKGRRKKDDDRAALNRLGEIATHCSRTEREAEAAEREILERNIISLLGDRIGERHAGFITGVVPFGLFVQMTDVFADGLVSIDALPGGDWVHDGRTHTLVQSTTGKKYRLGDRMDVTIVSADAVFRRVDLAPADGAAAGSRASSGRPGTRGRRKEAAKKTAKRGAARGAREKPKDEGGRGSSRRSSRRGHR